MTWTPNRVFTLIVGLGFTFLGILGFFAAPTMQKGMWTMFELDLADNLFHLLSGLLGILAVSTNWSRRFNRIFGSTYLLLGLLGFVPFLYFNGLWLGLVHINTMDNLLHIGVGIVALVVSFFIVRIPRPQYGRATNQITTTTKKNAANPLSHHVIGVTFWIIGFIILVIASFLTHFHPGPWPGELAFSRTVQGLQLWPWVTALIAFISSFNDPFPSAIAIVVWLLAMGLLRWFRPAVFLGLIVLVGNGINATIGDLVGRPRPSSHLIHVDYTLSFNSFPSGHTEHVVVFYGFLLFLSLTRPVRQWRYHWALLPFQIFVVLDILVMGYSRVLEGEHWVTDVLAGYLSGLLWLSLFIYLYHCEWTKNAAEKEKAMPGEWDGNHPSLKQIGTVDLHSLQ
jgi:membrane-associated phospholipid phosphatase